MSSQRKEIRQQVVDLLVNKTSVGERVYNSRDLDLPDHLLPCILVFTREDSVNLDKTQTHHSYRLFRDLELSIEVLVLKSIPNYADTLDDLSEEVTTILAQADSSGDLNCNINLMNLQGESMNFSSEGDRTIGINRITYNIEYLQDIRLSGANLDDYRRNREDLQLIKGQVELPQ